MGEGRRGMGGMEGEASKGGRAGTPACLSCQQKGAPIGAGELGLHSRGHVEIAEMKLCGWLYA